MQVNNGIIYLNAGTKMLPRLLVSLKSLRDHYSGPVSIISIGQESHDKCFLLPQIFQNINIVAINSDLKLRHYYWLEKSRVHYYTPYENSIFIDSDTLIVNNFNELFSEIEENGFVATRFAHWLTCGRTISKRLKQWSHIDQELVNQTIRAKRPSVNVGVYGFNKNSDFMKYWFDFTIQNPNSSLPEETSCHLLLYKFPNLGKIISNKYNCSCKHDDPRLDDVKIIHYHGRKHCRFRNQKPLYNADLWIDQWKKIWTTNLCNVQEWYNTTGDMTLIRNIRNIDNYVR